MFRDLPGFSLNSTKTTHGFYEDLRKSESTLFTNFTMVILVINVSILAIIFFVAVIN